MAKEMKLVIIRHGESEWNKLNLFTGWTDVDLTETGHEVITKFPSDEITSCGFPGCLFP